MSEYAGPITILMMIAFVAGGLFVLALTVNELHVEAVARGYAHYDVNSNWHWNGEGDQK